VLAEGSVGLSIKKGNRDVITSMKSSNIMNTPPPIFFLSLSVAVVMMTSCCCYYNLCVYIIGNADIHYNTPTMRKNAPTVKNAERDFKIYLLRMQNNKFGVAAVIFTGILIVYLMANILRSVVDVDYRGRPHHDVLRKGLEFIPVSNKDKDLGASLFLHDDRKHVAHLTKKFPNFDSASTEEKLERWRSEYNYRIKNDNHPVRAEIVRLMAKYAPLGGVMIDSGAHLGDTGIPILQKLREQHHRKDIHLVLLEPEYSKCLWIYSQIRYIDENLDPGFASRVHLVQTGVWSHSTHADLNKAGHPGAWKVEVDEYRLRSYMKSHSSRADFVPGSIRLLSVNDILTPQAKFTLWHLDVEDSETRALTGMLRTHHRPIVVIEAFSRKGTDFKFNSDFLRMNHGYRLTARLKPNQDRVLIPYEIDPGYLKELPEYI
jgi:hypothetical protein